MKSVICSVLKSIIKAKTKLQHYTVDKRGEQMLSYSRRFLMLFAPLLDLYFGQKTTIALWLCLHLFLHFRQRLLYVRLPVSGFMKKSHSCFAFFDNLGIVKTPFTCLNRESLFVPPPTRKSFKNIKTPPIY